jgi:protocatechuate 3,4-dioxygenase beta subunit
MKRYFIDVIRKNLLRLLIASGMIFWSTGCTSTAQTLIAPAATLVQTTPTNITASSHSCKPTIDDGVSPSYKPDAPERTVVGRGHVLTGVVLSRVDCQPIANAKLEFWPEEQGLGHPDSSRATFFTDQDGRYRFECNPPEHIHMRISAPGYRIIGVNSYHPEGKPAGTFDIVLIPEK